MKKIYPIPELCINCGRCIVACKTAHSKSKNPVKAYKYEQCPEARIRVEGDNDYSFASNCRHCAKPLCVEACISGAMTRDPETGVVYVNADKCVGCGTCVVTCPFGAVHVETKAIKCDLCGSCDGQPGKPSCVAACPNRALIYVESEGQ